MQFVQHLDQVEERLSDLLVFVITTAKITLD